ncbi:hypothetical protein [Saccharolobus islandicus]|uniref:Uncharacterized protein n=3 Tax=Saccharolobus islandicus TaxID=43080 RepID=C4KJV6_SACI6|nr:hypothetical protein [Sulfolobus islandicus]ACP38883.1 conserved hypothetical protein [Sulfolobus islandicus M.14.25]ACP56087.1 conserved hypothetical protein [Sulfolobus islandicus M.16.27]ACR42751.1 conserved hypothetical protein [Sulfolobus islandicus M.16.4]
MELPEEVKNNLNEGICLTCCNDSVVCMTSDYPKNANVEVLFEIDKEGREVIFRHIIMDDPSNPLTVEYSVDTKFVENVSRKKWINIHFVDENFNEKIKLRITFSDDEIRVMRREIGLGT